MVIIIIIVCFSFESTRGKEKKKGLVYTIRNKIKWKRREYQLTVTWMKVELSNFFQNKKENKKNKIKKGKNKSCGYLFGLDWLFSILWIQDLYKNVSIIGSINFFLFFFFTRQNPRERERERYSHLILHFYYGQHFCWLFNIAKEFSTHSIQFTL